MTATCASYAALQRTAPAARGPSTLRRPSRVGATAHHRTSASLSEARTRGEEQEGDADAAKNVSTSSRRRALLATIAAPLLPSLLSAATASPAAASAAELESKAGPQILPIVTSIFGAHGWWCRPAGWIHVSHLVYSLARVAGSGYACAHSTSRVAGSGGCEKLCSEFITRVTFSTHSF